MLTRYDATTSISLTTLPSRALRVLLAVSLASAAGFSSSGCESAIEDSPFDDSSSDSGTDGAAGTTDAEPDDSTADEPDSTLWQSATLDRPVAVGAWIQLSFVDPHGETPIDSIRFEPDGVFEVEQDVDPIHVRAVGEGTTVMTVITTTGIEDSVTLEAEPASSVDVTLPATTEGIAFGFLPLELADGAPLVLAPHASLRVRAGYLDATGEPLKGEGAGDWSVSDETLARVDGDDLSDVATVTALDGAEGTVSVMAGPGEGVDVAVHAGVAPVSMGVVGTGLLPLDEVNVSLGSFTFLALRAIDADGRYVHGYGSGACSAETADPSIAKVEAAFDLPELTEDPCAMLSSGLMVVRGQGSGSTVLTIGAGADTLEVPVHVP